MILQNADSDIVIPDDVSFSELILSRLREHGDKIAMVEVDENRRTTTFRQLHDRATLCAAALNQLGVTSGDVVAVSLGNRREFAVVFLATAACGGILTTCNPHYTKDEITKQFSHSRPKVVFVESSGYRMMRSVANRVNSIKNVFPVKSVNGSTSFEELLSNADRKDFPFGRRPDTRETPFFLPYSSGTTGLPKGVMLTHHNTVALVLLCSVTVLSATDDDIHYLVLPLFHMAGTMIIFSCLVNGAKMIVQQRFDVKGFLEAIQEYRVTKLSLVPPIVLAVSNSPLLSSYDTSSLKKIHCGGAPLSVGVGEEVKKKLNVELVQGWGLTEAVPLTAAMDPTTPLRSVGRVCPNTLLKIVDVETGRELEANEIGEICGKGPQVMMGYYKNPQATASTINSEGWIHTGDIGYFDKLGRVYVIDRLKELIKVKGFQVAPAELEEILLTHPNITDAAVIGVPDSESGEAPKAFLVKNDERLKESDIHQFLRGKVSSYKHLKGGVAFCDVIPKSASGKILRRQLRDRETRSRQRSLL